MTLSETEAALFSVDTEMKMLAERRARLLKHRQHLTGAPAPADERGEPNGEDIDVAYAEAQGDDVAPLPVADVKRWGAQFPWSKEVDRLKKECASAFASRTLSDTAVCAQTPYSQKLTDHLAQLTRSLAHPFPSQGTST